MTREQARQIALIETKKEIVEHGIDSIAVMAPNPGKNSWTWREMLEAIIEDKPLEDTDYNYIDGILSLEQWIKEHNQKSYLENEEYRPVKEGTLKVNELIEEIYSIFNKK